MKNIGRRRFLYQAGIIGIQVSMLSACDFQSRKSGVTSPTGVKIDLPKKGEDIFAYLKRRNGSMDIGLYRQIIGAANEFKEGDQALNLTAVDEPSRTYARSLLSNTTVGSLDQQSVFSG